MIIKAGRDLVQFVAMKSKDKRRLSKFSYVIQWCLQVIFYFNHYILYLTDVGRPTFKVSLNQPMYYSLNLITLPFPLSLLESSLHGLWFC